MITKEQATEKFKAFCHSSAAKDPELDELDWYDMSVGFFLALGLSVEDAYDVATKCRYTHKYWC
jgi:hypothetical protein